MAIKTSAHWMPIDTAPRDGTRVLLYRTDWVEDTCVGFWNDVWKEWNTVNGSVFPEASHWATLPQPPAGVNNG